MRPIGRVPPTADGERRRFDDAVKEGLEKISGLRGSRVVKLPNGASSEEIVAKINELIDLLQK